MQPVDMRELDLAEDVRAFLVRAHRAAVRGSRVDGIWHYDAYPHHLWSVPWLFEEAARLDPADIVAFRVSLEAVCARVDGDGVSGTVGAAAQTCVQATPR